MAHIYEVYKVEKGGACAVVVGHFAWFTQSCSTQTKWRLINEDGDHVPVCKEHLPPKSKCRKIARPGT